MSEACYTLKQFAKRPSQPQPRQLFDITINNYSLHRMCAAPRFSLNMLTYAAGVIKY